jgi:hypothetical protein
LSLLVTTAGWISNLIRTTVAAQVKKLTARVEALERLLDRIVRQKPVSERQLEKALKSRDLRLG